MDFNWWLLIPIGIALLGVLAHGIFLAIVIFLVGYAGGAFVWDHGTGIICGFIFLTLSICNDTRDGGSYSVRKQHWWNSDPDKAGGKIETFDIDIRKK